jgi:TATA-box binding protein (TBP) (component of TFIID and TFIIIB)
MEKIYSKLNDEQKYVLEKFNKVIEKSYLPDEVSISTIAATTRLGGNCEEDEFLFKLENIAKYLKLKNDGICGVNCGKEDDTEANRSLIDNKNKKRKNVNNKSNNKKKTQFFNQVTLTVKLPIDKYIHVKIFGNGSIHMPGCSSGYDFLFVLEKICNSFSAKQISVNNDDDSNTIIYNPFVDKPKNLVISCINKIGISMINSDFKLPFHINRENLTRIMKNDPEYSINPCVSIRNVSVGIKFREDNEPSTKTKATILVFNSGSVIITGAKNCIDISKAYFFINRVILENDNWKYIISNEEMKNIIIKEFMLKNDLFHN